MVQIPLPKLKELLMHDGLITEDNFNSLAEEAERMGQNMADVLISKNIISQSYFYELVTRFLGTERANLLTGVIDLGVLIMIAENIARERRVIAFKEEPGGIIDVAMEDPGDLETLQFLKQHLGKEIRPFLAMPEDLDKGFLLYGAEQAKDFNNLIARNIEQSLKSRASGAEEKALELPVVEIIDNIISFAVSQRASDIHIEVFVDSILLRFRVDGVLREVFRMPKEISPAVIARVKLLSGLKIDEHMKPQDGRFRHKAGNEITDIRVSIIPTFYGEKIVMRLLPASQKPLSLEELGMFPDIAKIVKDNIKKTYGMFLITGPTGSGKTTTLYSILDILNQPEVNIVTIEDPIEYDMKYVNQTQINTQAGITFAGGLRSLLRQDPNIIMVGEIRDEETADISVHAALTGHLLLSSLHTNDAPTAVPRLVDMKVPAFLVAAVLNAVLAQRLVRKICVECIYSYAPEPSLEKIIQKQLDDLGIKEIFKLPKMLYKGKGCQACGDSGFKGRLGIYEILDVTEDTRKEIVNPAFTLDSLYKIAREHGMVTMFEDGLRKAERGLTTIEEILRVIRE